jgi:hypothetical protein
MLKGLLPPFKIGEKRSFLYKDSIGGASPMEYLGLVTWIGLFVSIALDIITISKL